jgi:primosomal protein N' (replication factor Y)
MTVQVLGVAVPVPLPRVFDYRPPPGLAVPADAVGRRVRVPFGPREHVGVVVAVTALPAATAAGLRPAHAWLDESPLLGGELLDTLRWASAYYAHPLGEVIQAALPVVLRRAQPPPVARGRHYLVTAAGERAAEAPAYRRRKRLLRLLALLATGPRTAAEIAEHVTRAGRLVDEALAEGLIEIVSAHLPTAPALIGPPLDPQQAEAVAAIAAAAGGYAAFLLDGVTGSGKTEVYLTAIRACIERGRQALVLVPEIGLTPQALRRYRERLGVPIAMLHSGLADGARAQAWLAAARGDAPVVLGTRSAVLTPLARPGLIVVDEEHDASYKQQDGWRYHARDLAVVRARALGVPVVLGSATPSLESLANVAAGRYRSLQLTRRAGRAEPPRMQVVDLRRQRLHDGLSEAAIAALAQTLERGEQALVFRNRRGYAPTLLCHDCGWYGECPRCDARLTVHRASRLLRCHHCSYETALPKQCPACGSDGLMPLGVGTERLEEHLAARFPDARILRFDRDSTRTRSEFEERYAAIEADGPAILVGTQMLAKGHDLPRLTLVVLVDVDAGLFSTDFRGPERLAQMVVQVAGRAGRADRPGTVMLQTHHPDHPLLRTLLADGYAAFAAAELEARRLAQLPPAVHLVVIRAEARDAAVLERYFAAVRELIGETAEVGVRGPLPAAMARRDGYLRRQLVLEAGSRAPLQRLLARHLEALHALPAARRVRWAIDVDPLEVD